MKKAIALALAATATATGAGLLAYNKVTTVNFGDIIIDGIPEKTADAVRIMSFNLRSINDKEGSIKNRSKIAASIIKQYTPDSLGVQEATGQWMDILLDVLTDKYNYVTQARDTKGYHTEHNTLFYLKDKYTLIDSGTIWLSETPEIKYTKSFNSNCYRIATWATLENKQTKKRYTHLNTHLDHILEETRVRQTEVLIDKLKKLQCNSKVVCTGDFNTEPTSEVYTKMTAITADSKSMAKTGDSGITFHGYGKISDELAGPIDYIFVPVESEVETYKIIRNTAKNMYPSDHYPIIADVVL